MAAVNTIDPLVSVCIPAYNAGKYITETLTAFTRQAYRRIELIVVDDGSTDDTFKIVQKFDDERIKLIKTANAGASSARNTAYRYSNGEYIIFFDADDYVEPDFIAGQLAAINSENDVVVLSNWGRFYQDDMSTAAVIGVPSKSITFKEWIATYWHKCNPMTNPGRAIIPRNLIEKAGLWNEALSLYDDLEFFSRLFAVVRMIAFNSTGLLYYRSGINGLSGKFDLKARKSLYTSVSASVDIALAIYSDDPIIKKSCANMLQNVIHELYPDEKQLIKIAEARINDLGGADLTAPAGGYTKFLITLVGWKAAKRLKTLFNRRHND